MAIDLGIIGCSWILPVAHANPFVVAILFEPLHLFGIHASQQHTRGFLHYTSADIAIGNW
jgi:hypothetical protein